MQHPTNLKPDERLSYIEDLASSSGVESVIEYFVKELSSNIRFKHFDDKCYWINVEEVLNSKKSV